MANQLIYKLIFFFSFNVFYIECSLMHLRKHFSQKRGGASKPGLVQNHQ